MKLGFAALALALAAQDSAPPAEPDWVAKLPPRKPIAGLAGFHTTSRIVYAEAPDLPHVLETTYVFPDRVRWFLALVDGDLGDRSLEYRCGSSFFELRQRSSQSAEVPSLEGDAPLEWWADHAKAKCSAMELRRALFLWPDGFAWRGEGNLRVATTTCSSEAIEIQAVLDVRGRPTEISADPIWSYRNIEWRETKGRWWPASLDLYTKVDLGTGEHRDARLWTETVDSVETSIHLLDEFFVPPDRRGGDSATRTAASEIEALDLPAEAISRFELATGTDWPAALARAKSWRTDARERAAKSKREIEAASLIELDASGRPRAVLARLVGGEGAVPEGFVATPARRALSRWVPVDASAIGAAVAELRARLPVGSRAGLGYVRITAPDSPDPLAQVVLPYEEPH